MVKASLLPPCLAPLLVLQLARSSTLWGREYARRALARLRELGVPQAKELLREWEEAEAAAARRFQDAVNGRLTSDPEALALAARFYDSPAKVIADPKYARKYSGNTSTAFGVLRRRPMTDLECAQACAYGTALAMGASRAFFNLTNEEMAMDGADMAKPTPEGCRAYALLKGGVCLVSSEQLSSDEKGPGEGRLRNLPTPAALNFCVAARSPKTLGSLTVTSCQNTLTEQYTSSGAVQLSGLRNQVVLKHVCRTECEALLGALEKNDEDFYGSIGQHLHTLCTLNVVQLVEAHELECCGSACGWDPVSRTCAGIHLLSNVAQEEWFAECCSPSAVMLGSDRDYMCKSASRAIWKKVVSPKEEPQPGALEAFFYGQDLGPKFEGGESAAPVLPAGPAVPARPPSTSTTQVATTRKLVSPAAAVPTTRPTQPPLTSVTSPQPQGKLTTLPSKATPTCRNVTVGPSTANSKVVPLPLVSMTCGTTPVNKQDPSWKQTFAVDISRSTILVRRTDAKKGWEQPLELSCCAPTALVELEGRAWRQQPDTFGTSPCTLKCADPTFMKSALLQCSASTSREWVAIKDGTPSCPQAGLIKSEKKQSPEDCARLGASTPGATHASWQFLPGDKSEGRPQQGLCALYQKCAAQARSMFASAKAQMSNDTEVLWRRLTSAL